jgi:AcrR family transcriptional regulator
MSPAQTRAKQASRSAERPGKPTANDEMSARTKRLLVDAAIKLFSAAGYAETSLQELVTEAGVTKGAFYHHYRSKEEILRQIHDDFIDGQIERAEAAVREGSTPSESLRALIRFEMGAISEHQDAVTVFLRERRAFGPETWKEVRAKRDRLEAVFVNLVKDGIAAGEFRDGDPQLIAYGILGMVHWSHEWYRPRMGPTDKVADTFADMVLDGLVR